MAIVKTTFASGSSNISQVAAWLQANATDYFDDISLSGTTITCTKDSHTALIINGGSSSEKFKMYISNGSYGSLNGSEVLFGISTSKGLLLRSLNNYGANNYSDIIITKTDSNTLAFVAVGVGKPSDGGSSYASAYYYAIDFDSIALTPWIATSPSTPSRQWAQNQITKFYQADKTSIANIVCKNTGSYTPGVYQMVFSQYSDDTTGIITLDGNEYFINGCFALAD